MDSEDEVAWNRDVIAALSQLTVDDVAAVEILLLDALALWIFSPGNPGSGYDENQGGIVIGALLDAVSNSAEFSPERRPEPTEAIAATRRQIVHGARELSESSNGLTMLITRLMPAAIGEMERNANDALQQVYWTYYYALLVLAGGADGAVSPEIAQGVIMTFGAWNDLMSDGFVLPWRETPDATGDL